MPETINLFQQQLVCSICLDRYKQPKLLPCQHTFCLSPCLTNLADRVTNRIKCPECRTVHTLPFQGVEALPNNLTLLRFLELDFDSVPSNCFQCERRGQNTKCPDCGKYFCQNCKRIHLAHLQNEIRLKISNIRKALNKTDPIKTENPVYDEIKREITRVFATLIAELKKREMDLINEVESYKQREMKNDTMDSTRMTISEVNSAEINYFCDLTESIINTSQAVNENQLAKMKQQCQVYINVLNKPKTTNQSTSIENRLNFSLSNLNELKNLIQKLGSLSQDPVQGIIYEQNQVLYDKNESQSNRQQRATWNKAPASFTIDFSSSNQAKNVSQSTRENKDDPTPKPINRSKTFVISTEPVENLNQLSRSVDVNALYNVKPQARAKTPLAFNVMLDEPSNLVEPEEAKSQDFLVSSLLDLSKKPRIDYSLKNKALKIIGKKGKENGEFNWPIDLAINSFNNTILITDSSNHRIQIFDQDGKFLRSFGSMGNKDGEFNSPAGIFVDSMSNVYVVDRLNHRIQIFDRYCRFLRSISPSQGNQPGQLNNPWGIAVNRNSEILVCDKENDRVCVFNQSGKFLRSFGQSGSKNGSLDKPCYVHITKDDKIFVSDSMNNRIQVFDSSGVFLFKFGSEGSKSGEFKIPRGITSDQEGFILVADSGNSRIQVFKNDGSYVTEFGSRGTDSGKLQGIEGLSVDKNSNILICDKDNNRIQIL